MDDKTPREPLKGNYPSNSKIKKTEGAKPDGKKVIKKVVTGTVKQQKPSFGKKVLAFLFEDDTRSVGSYIVHDVLVPAAKSMLSDMVGGGLDMLLFGERRGNRTRRENGRSYVSYGSYYHSPDRDRDRDREDVRDREKRRVSDIGRARHDFDEILLETRGEAEEVLSNLVDLTLDYGVASVADLYELVGVTTNFVDNKWGWTDLRDAHVDRVRGGYLLKLPQPVSLD
jgi:hypothetical protein